MKKTRSVSENHAKAPLCAEFVKAMRDVFGPQVKVLWVKEGDVEEGRPSGRLDLELVAP